MEQLSAAHIRYISAFNDTASNVLSAITGTSVGIKEMNRQELDCFIEFPDCKKFRLVVKCDHPDYPLFVLGNTVYECLSLKTDKEDFLQYFPDGWSIEKCFEFIDKLILDNKIFDQTYDGTDMKFYNEHTIKEVYSRDKRMIIAALNA